MNLCVNEYLLCSSPLPPDELAAIIYEACGEDLSACALTQVSVLYNFVMSIKGNCVFTFSIYVGGYFIVE